MRRKHPNLVVAWLLLLIVPNFCTLLGDASNRIAVYANGGVMPVYEHDCGADPTFQMELLTHRQTHTCADAHTKLHWLCDWIETADWISSPGDYLIQFGLEGLPYIFCLWFGLGLGAICVFERETSYRVGF